MAFRALIDSFFSCNHDEQSEAEVTIKYLCENELESFLSSVFEIICVDDVQLQTRAICLLYTQVKRNSNFFRLDIVGPFSSSFVPVFVDLLLKQSSSENSKNFLVSIMAELMIYYVREVHCCQLNLFCLQLLNENTMIAPHILHCISEVYYGYKDDCLFPFEVILFCIQELSFPFSSRTELYFSLCSHYPENDTLNSLFPQFLDAIPRAEIPLFYQLLSDFIEQNSSILMNNLDVFLDFIEKSVFSDLISARISSILFIAHFFKCVSDIIVQFESFLVSIFELLIRIIAEIDDSASWEVDNNDIQPYTIARQVFGEITHTINTSLIIISIKNFYKELSSQSSPKWEDLYSLIAAISEMSPSCLSLLLPNRDQTNDYSAEEIICSFTLPIIRLLENENLHPRLRMTIYEAIDSFCVTFAPVFQTETFSYFFPKIQIYIMNEMNPYVRIHSLKSLASFIKTLSYKELVTVFPEFFDGLLDYLFIAPEQDYSLILKCLGLYAMGIGSKFVDRIEIISQVLCEIYMNTNSNSIAFSVIEAFSYIYSHIHLCDSYVCVAQEFFTVLWNMRDEIYDPNQLDSCDLSIHLLIHSLGENVVSFAEMIYQSCISSISQSIDHVIVKRNEMSVDVSCLIRIKSHISNAKVYVNENQVKEITFSLSIINESIGSYKYIFGSRISEIFHSVLSCLKSDLCLDKMKNYGWLMLSSSISLAGEIGMAHSILFEMLLVFKKEIDSQNSTPFLYRQMILHLDSIINETSHLFDEGLAINLLDSLFYLCNNIIRNNDSKYGKDNMEESNKYKEVLQVAPVLFKSIFVEFKDHIGGYFESKLEPAIMDYIEYIISARFAVEVYFDYIIVVNDDNRFSKLFPLLACLDQSQDPDLYSLVFSKLHESFFRFPLNEASFGDYFQFLLRYINDNMDNIEDYLPFDIIISAFASLIKNNPTIAPMKEAIDIIFECLPIQEIDSTSDTPYSLIADIIEQYDWINKREYFSLLSYHVLHVFDTGIITNDTKQRFNVYLGTMLSNPITRKWFEEEWLSISYGPIEKKTLKHYILANKR